MDDTHKLVFESVSPDDRFLIMVDAIARRMNSDKIASLSQKDIDKMLDKTRQMDGMRYKNPLAYILGYIATNGGVRMEKNTIIMVINKILPELRGEGGIEPPDVIRYARYWKQNL